MYCTSKLAITQEPKQNFKLFFTVMLVMQTWKGEEVSFVKFMSPTSKQPVFSTDQSFRPTARRKEVAVVLLRAVRPCC